MMTNKEFEKLKKRNEKMFWVMLLVVICSIGFVVTAGYDNYQVAKPLMIDVKPVPPSVKLQRFSFSFDPSSMRYTNVNFEVMNVGAEAIGADVTVIIFDEGFNEIANGNGRSVMLGPDDVNSFSIDVAWVPGASVLDYTSISITLQEFKQ